MGSQLGTMKAAAAVLGIPFSAYQAHLRAGDKWCTGCKAWHQRSAFARDKTRRDGLTVQCKAWKIAHKKRFYVRRPRRSKLGSFFVATRDGDHLQARARTNQAVRTGVLPSPNDLPCTDCGHDHASDGKRHEYDHHLGYSAEHQLSVQAVCVSCHRKRDANRRRRTAEIHG